MANNYGLPFNEIIYLSPRQNKFSNKNRHRIRGQASSARHKQNRRSHLENPYGEDIWQRKWREVLGEYS